MLQNSFFETISRFKKIYDTEFKKKVKLPLIVTEEYLYSSCDVFPIEFLSIKDDYKVIYGRDILAGLAFSQEDIRMECESNIKGRIIVLQQAYLKGTDLPQLLHESFPFFYITLKNIARLSLKDHSSDPAIVFEVINRIYHVDCAVFQRIIDNSRNGRLGNKLAREIFPEYMDQLGLMAIAINAVNS